MKKKLATIQPLEVYDELREMHKRIRKIWDDEARGERHKIDHRIEMALNCVDAALYAAESFMVELDANA